MYENQEEQEEEPEEDMEGYEEEYQDNDLEAQEIANMLNGV